LKKFINMYGLLLVIAGVVVALDQYTKALVRTQLGFNETWNPVTWLAPYARVVHWQNTGAAFGMFQGGNLVFSILAVLVTIAIIYYFPRVPASETTLRIAMSLQLGGALGNLVDRVTAGEVTDFISVLNFPVWNIADASITMGVVVLLLGMWFKDWRKPKRAEPAVVDMDQANAGPGSPEGGTGE
jgi:signal peptidase II